ncbi:hypothetical protein Saso_49300 [Streptomyces asoensis]|uniref:Uncharacterized protein n=1 Tax=Streptomyces asoensis TaxID=249586 RepID=A0ABQ3S582_9ACTN|nr:hypothetical protein GCM10010496_30390 [Streptomyces asoensis]GHI63280.1 hypothetical protein Saso_49300 [Streptomyces asoensis]
MWRWGALDGGDAGRRCAGRPGFRMRGDQGADAAVVRVEPDVEPLVGRTQRGVGDGLAGEDRGAIVVLVHGVVRPGYGLPRQGAQEAFGLAAQQPGGRVVEVGDAALEVEAQGADGQALQQVGGGETALRWGPVLVGRAGRRAVGRGCARRLAPGPGPG